MSRRCLLFVDAQDHQMVQSLLRHGPERVFFFFFFFFSEIIIFFFSEIIGPAAAGPAGPAPALLKK